MGTVPLCKVLEMFILAHNKSTECRAAVTIIFESFHKQNHLEGRLLNRISLPEHYIYDHRHEKTCFSLHMRNEGKDQLRGNPAAYQRLCFRYIDGTIPLLPQTEIASLEPSSVTVQPSLGRTWSETQIQVFLGHSSYTFQENWIALPYQHFSYVVNYQYFPYFC